MAVVTCPGCGRGGLRVPDGRRGRVTCPSCGAEWFYPESIELSEVEFRCAQSGARFLLQLARRSPLHKFVIQAIKDAPPPANAKRADATPASASQAIESGRSSMRELPAPKSGGLLARLFQKAGPATPIPASGSSWEITGTAPVRHDASEYNWASFFCPYCNAVGFVECRGGHLTCDGTAELRIGRRFHQCFCGNAGFIEGTIRTIEARTANFEVAPETSQHRPPQNADATEKSATNALLSSAANSHLRKIGH